MTLALRYAIISTYQRKGVEQVDDLKDALAIAKDLLQILVLILTALKLTKKDEKPKSKSKRGK